MPQVEAGPEPARPGEDDRLVGRGSAFPAPVPEALWREVAELGLTAHEAQVLVGLLRLGSATIPQLAAVTEVPEVNIYRALKGLGARNLAEQLPKQRPMIWATRGWDSVQGRLDAMAEEQLRQHRDRAERVRNMLAESFDESPAVALPYVHVLRRAVLVQETYNQMLRDAEDEILNFTRPPYASGKVNSVVLETLARGVRARVLYQAGLVDDPTIQPWLHAYHAAGVEGRLVDALPLKLVIADRRVVLLSLPHPTEPEIGYPTTLHIEHPGYAELQAVAFEQLWATARPFEAPATR